MKKNRLFIFLLAVLFLFLTVPVFAQSHVSDNAGLLNIGEISELEKLTEKISSTYNFELVIVTETNIGGAEPMVYADDFFDYNGFKGRDGCLFLHVTGTRDYWFSTSGRGIKILNSTAFDKLESDVVNFLSDNDPANAYRAFISAWEEFLALDAKGKSYNFITRYALIMYIAAWIVSLIIALLAVLVMKAKMNTALPKTEADSFIIPGSLVFTNKKDAFLYSVITKTKIVKSSSSNSHTSSSGGRHGGGGGKY